MARTPSFTSKYPDLAAELFKYIEPVRPEPRPTSVRKRGRPDALSGQRRLKFVRALAATFAKNKGLNSASRIAALLKKRPEYAMVSERTLRRDVQKIIDLEIGYLKMFPPDYWKEYLGISPPEGDITKKVLREKSFELMRHHLRRHELLAKKR